MKRSITSLPLHYGKAPAWLFQKMKRLSAAIMEIIIMEFGPEEFLARISDPLWFQAMGCVVGFDWHSSGVTTTLCGALKEGLSALGDDSPLAICGGKAKRAIRTPDELTLCGEKWGMDVSRFIQMSRLCAKIDNAAIQDGHTIYHHTFLLTKKGEWAIIQQGMNGAERTARRYQWLSRDNLDVVSEPHSGITCDKETDVLNLVAKESLGARDAVVDFAKEHPDTMMRTWRTITLEMPKRHYISPMDFDEKRLQKTWRGIYEVQPKTFQDLIGIRGVGPRTISALALVSELVYNTPPSFQDPARFSFAHGGKDGYPFPVDKKTYEKSIDFLKMCLDKSKVGDREKITAFKRLSRL
ncbi:MAG: hypothetical protein H6Q54_994 [Deltaproteobacteria bacterium]|nr:hypothetical protein [Deltaproteobacteria bacterium]